MAESWVLDSLALHDSTFQIRAEGVDMTPPKAKPEWIGAADSEWQALVRDPNYENRTIVLPMMIAPQTTKDLMFDKIGQIRDKLAKASKYPGGIVLAWIAHGSARTINFDVLAGEVSEFVYDHHANVQNRARLTITLTAKPYWYGTETLSATTSSSTPFVSAPIANTIGDVPALGRLIVTDTATQSRRHVEWGLEGPLTYNASTSLLIDSDDMVTSGFAGTQASAGSAYDPNASGNNHVTATTYGPATALAGTGALSHVGSFRVKGRVGAGAPSVAQFRLSWRVADGPMRSNGWVSLPSSATSSNWCEVDLGMISIPAVLSGTQAWTGQVEAKTTGGGSSVSVDYLVLVPATVGYGKARASYSYRSGVLAGFDDFTGTTATAALNARVAPTGGTWATSGSATDFAFSDETSGLSTDGEGLLRSTNSDAGRRFAVLGTSVYTDTDVVADVGTFGAPSTSSYLELGVFARWVDSSNYLFAYRKAETSATGAATRSLIVEQVVAGVTTVLSSVVLPASLRSSNVTHQIRLLVFSSGRFIAVQDTAGAIFSVEGTSAVLATGGALDDGKVGLADRHTGIGSTPRYYDNFAVAVAAAEPIVIYSGRNMQIRHDDTIRQDSSGTYTGRPQFYRGSRFLVPVGTSRVLAKARRNDIDTAPDDNVTDATQIQIGVTPRGLVVPRS